MAAYVVIAAFSDHDRPATRAFASLAPKLFWIDEICKEAGLLSTSLLTVHSPHLLVPPADLVVVKEPAVAACKVVISLDFLVAAPTKVRLAVLTEHLAATIGLLNAFTTLWAALCCLGK